MMIEHARHAEGSEYLVSVVGSSRDIRSAASFILKKEVFVADNLVDLSPDTNSERLPSSMRLKKTSSFR